MPSWQVPRLFVLLLYTSAAGAATYHQVYLGCFGDDPMDRDLTGPNDFTGTYDSPDKCQNFCENVAPGAPYEFFGLQFYRECYCGRTHGRLGKYDEAECPFSCDGNMAVKCGGSNRNSVYKLVYDAETPAPPTPAPPSPAPPTPVPPTVSPPTPSPPTPVPPTPAPPTPAPDTPSPPTPAPPTPAPVTPAPPTPSPPTPAPPTPAPPTLSPPTPAPPTPAPPTPSPPTPAPDTPVPQTPAPPTPAPPTPSPPTPAPDTPSPPTPAPLTPAPLTPSPPTPAPDTPSPPTPMPPTPSPPTPAPLTSVPPTPAPDTPAPLTPVPPTPAPPTPAPLTLSPPTPAPDTPSPPTPAPLTSVPPTPSPPTPAPDTPAPLTPVPPTPAPPTPAPLTLSPPTPAPDTPSPPTPAPLTPVPPTPSPPTPAPDTPSPPTPVPLTPAPPTPVPPTPSPPTPAPETPVPPTPAPPTPAPLTPAPLSPSPPTPVPQTLSPPTTAPQTPAPATPAPGTPSPSTPAPDTAVPPTAAPATPAPLTPEPQTPVPQTLAPVTPSPSTPAPDTPVPPTPAPLSPTPSTPGPTAAPSTPSPPTPAPATPAPDTPVPPTAAPTQAPLTPSPPTPAPDTAVPLTPSPQTPEPQTLVPLTPSPATPMPLTPTPQTPVPLTASPDTPTPATPAPTGAPATPAPLTATPVTPAPATSAPLTLSPPVTAVPLTPTPRTPAPPVVALPTLAPGATLVPGSTSVPQAGPSTPAPTADPAATVAPDTLPPGMTEVPRTFTPSVSTPSPPGSGPFDTPSPPGEPTPAPEANATTLSPHVRDVVSVPGLDSTAGTIAAGAAGAGAGFSTGAALRLALVSQGCSTELQEALHPTGLQIDGSTEVGAVVVNTAAIIIFSILSCIAMSIVSRVGPVLFPKMFEGTDVVGLLRLPSAPLMVFQYFYQGLTLAAMCLVLRPHKEWHIALGGMMLLLCTVLPCMMQYMLYVGINTSGVYAVAEGRKSWVEVTFLGRGEWVNITHEVMWVQRYVILRTYKQNTTGFLLLEFAASFALSAIQSTGPENSSGCGHVKMASATVFFVLVMMETMMWPHARPRDAALDIMFLGVQMVAMLLMATGFYLHDLDLWVFDVASSLLTVAFAVLVAKIVLDILTEVYVLLTRRRDNLQDDVLSRVEPAQKEQGQDTPLQAETPQVPAHLQASSGSRRSTACDLLEFKDSLPTIDIEDVEDNYTYAGEHPSTPVSSPRAVPRTDSLLPRSRGRGGKRDSVSGLGWLTNDTFSDSFDRMDIPLVEPSAGQLYPDGSFRNLRSRQGSAFTSPPRARGTPGSPRRIGSTASLVTAASMMGRDVHMHPNSSFGHNGSMRLGASTKSHVTAV